MLSITAASRQMGTLGEVERSRTNEELGLGLREVADGAHHLAELGGGDVSVRVFVKSLEQHTQVLAFGVQAVHDVFDDDILEDGRVAQHAFIAGVLRHALQKEVQRWGVLKGRSWVVRDRRRTRCVGDAERARAPGPGCEAIR